ncbi:MAG: STAS domain-containing protein [Polaromonas sp.]|nr:STAS domain-containing protein [Polaromonas sp.]
MAKEDTSPGLLSKMVKFVRNPAMSWTELDNKETDRDEAVSKLLLEEMIERKRSDDLVRKREFDMLREMRKREAMVGQDPGGRPSFFQSSLPSTPDDRAKTIKKIDEIEAQMSMQWSKTRQGTASSLQSVDSSSFPVGIPFPPLSKPPTAPLAVKASAVRERGADSPGLPAGDGATERMDLMALKAAALSTPDNASPMMSAFDFGNPEPTKQHQSPKPVVLNALAASAKNSEDGSTDFSYTNMMAMDVQEVAHDAELEEASISFANSDDAAAEAALLEMLAPGGSRAGQSEVWMALFDLYRATDSQEKFENAAIKFVQKFDRSAPQWFSMPAMVKELARPAIQALVSGQTANWICSSTLGIQTVAALKAALAKAPMPWRLNWNNLKTIEANAVEPLCKVFAGWAAQPVQLRFSGDAHLLQILQNATPTGDRATPLDRWRLRMEALRVTHRADEFELAALDFCVTYEVSPPAWDVARCQHKPMDSQGMTMASSTIIGDVHRDSVPSSVLGGDTQMDSLYSQMSNLSSVELSGHIEGDAIAMLEQLETKLMGADIIMISCAKLIRVDFSAAGSLLNWVSARQAENREVQFTDVNRLVAAFFNVIGITEYAKVTIRMD